MASFFVPIFARSRLPRSFRAVMIMSLAPDDAPTHSAATRASLLFRLRDWRDHRSWTEFYQLYQKLVHGIALRSGLTASEAEEVTQDVFKRVAEKIAEFESHPARGSFRAWLMNLTRWRVTDKFRERQRAARFQSPAKAEAETSQTSTLERVPDLTQQIASDELWEEEWEKRVLDAAFARLRDRVDARHFQIFELHVCQGKSVPEIARQLDTHRAAIYVIHFRLKKLLAEEVQHVKDAVD